MTKKTVSLLPLLLLATTLTFAFPPPQCGDPASDPNANTPANGRCLTPENQEQASRTAVFLLTVEPYIIVNVYADAMQHAGTAFFQWMLNGWNTDQYAALASQGY